MNLLAGPSLFRGAIYAMGEARSGATAPADANTVLPHGGSSHSLACAPKLARSIYFKFLFLFFKLIKLFYSFFLTYSVTYGAVAPTIHTAA